MRRTPTQDQLVAHPQSIVAPTHARVMGCELRWQRPEWGLSYPESSQPSAVDRLIEANDHRCREAAMQRLAAPQHQFWAAPTPVRRQRQWTRVLSNQELKGANDEH